MVVLGQGRFSKAESESVPRRVNESRFRWVDFVGGPAPVHSGSLVPTTFGTTCLALRLEVYRRDLITSNPG